jgi:hypothetical protein
MESTSLVLSIVSIANMVVLGVLIFIFGKMYGKTKAQLPLGMIVVTSMLFLHNIIGGLAYFSMDQLFSHEIFPYMLGVGIAELAGLLIFLKITYTLIFDYVFYFSTFGSLYYLDNRKKYLLKSGKTDKERLQHDLIKIITSLGIAEIVYTIARWLLQYYFLSIDYDPYLASIVSQVISTIIYMIVVNLSVKMTRLYKDGS